MDTSDKKRSNTCMALSMYALMYYLLLMDEETILHRTYYVLGTAVPKSVSDRLNGHYLWSSSQKRKQVNLARWGYKLWTKLVKGIKYPFLKETELYAQDIGVLSVLIGKRQYKLLPDGPNFLTLNMNNDSAEYIRMQRIASSFIGKLQNLMYGPVFVHFLGDNNQCKEIYLSEENYSPVLNRRKVHIHPLAEMWESSSESKQKLIMDIFDIQQADLELINSRPVIFFSQPLVEDSILDEEEYLNLLKKILAHYNTSEVLIKTHPRDHFDYKKHFCEISVFDKKVNIQLLAFFCEKTKRVSTIFSTSVEAFPLNVEVDWFGTEAHPNIERHYGKGYVAKRPHNHIEL